MDTRNFHLSHSATVHKAKAQVLQTMFNTSGPIVIATAGKVFKVDPGDPLYQFAKSFIESMAVHHITSKLVAAENNFQVLPLTNRAD